MPDCVWQTRANRDGDSLTLSGTLSPLPPLHLAQQHQLLVTVSVFLFLSPSLSLSYFSPFSVDSVFCSAGKQAGRQAVPITNDGADDEDELEEEEEVEKGGHGGKVFYSLLPSTMSNDSRQT